MPVSNRYKQISAIDAGSILLDVPARKLQRGELGRSACEEEAKNRADDAVRHTLKLPSQLWILRLTLPVLPMNVVIMDTGST